MVLNSKETTVAYRCPACGKNILSLVGIFRLTGDLIKLKCDCGQSELILSYTRDSKVRLTVPCLLCPTPHNYTVSLNTFFDRDLFTLSCPYSDVDICFIGTAGKVQEALKKSDEDLLALLTQAGLDDFDRYREGQELLDQDRDDESDFSLEPAQVEDVARFMLAELRDEDAIHCGCPDGEGDYDFEFYRDGIRIFCTKCGKSVRIPLGGVTAVQRFLHIGSLELTDDGPDEDENP